MPPLDPAAGPGMPRLLPERLLLRQTDYGPMGVLFERRGSLYPIARFVIEAYGADPRGMWGFFGLFTLSESQTISLPVLLFGLAACAVLSRRTPVGH